MNRLDDSIVSEGFSYYNYITGEYDKLSTSPEDWRPYLPQDPIVQNLYILYLQMGETPLQAAAKVLSLLTGAGSPGGPLRST